MQSLAVYLNRRRNVENKAQRAGTTERKGVGIADVLPFFRLQENLRRLRKVQRRTREAEIEKPIARIGVGANLKPTAVSGTS